MLEEASDCATEQVIQLEDELVTWFEEQGINVHQVDRGPFIEEVRAVHNGPMATWDQETYDRLQGIE